MKLNSLKVTGTRRSLIIHTFFEQFLGIINRKRTGFLCCKDTLMNEDKKDYFRDILEFCLSTDVCSRLNVSVTDIMHLDLPSYRKLKDMLKSIQKPESKEMESVLNKLKLS